ncbi:MAG: hypothetical protein K2K57_13720 [Oscillospiraceae bacterium]|nr:hypothetical protein [Oscillospiraceae bacterium]
MYNIKILENAVTAAIELAEGCKPDSRSDCRDIYHIVKFVRASIRDFPEITDKAMFDTLSMHAARLRKIAGGKITRHVIVSDSGEIFPLSITNTYGSLAHLIRRKLLKKDVTNFLRLHKIAELFMQRFCEYSGVVNTDPIPENMKMQDCLFYAFFLVVGRYVDLLEQAMKREDIPYDEISV